MGFLPIPEPNGGGWIRTGRLAATVMWLPPETEESTAESVSPQSHRMALGTGGSANRNRRDVLEQEIKSDQEKARDTPYTAPRVVGLMS